MISVCDVTPLIGDEIVFTLTVVNNGPSNATGVEVVDQLPSGYTYVSDNSEGAYNPASGLWIIGNMANGASVELQITATVNASGNYMNIAVVDGDQDDPDISNNTDSAETYPDLIGPITFNEFIETCQNTPYSGNVLDNGDFDPLGGELFISTVPVLDPSFGTISLTANGDFTYTPNNGYSGYDLSVVGVCNEIGCINDTLFITVHPSPVISNVIINDPICFGEASGSINITVNGGTPPYTYLWSNGTVGEDASNLISGTYDVLITDANGCQVAGGPYELTDPEPETIIVTDIVHTECNAAIGSARLTSSDGSSITLNGITQPSGSIFTDLPAGYHIATSNGICPATVGFNILNTNSDLFAMISEQIDVSCYGGSDGSVTVSVSGGTAPYSYSLSGGTPQASPTFSGLAAGEYGILVTDAIGCTFNVSFDVDEPQLLILSLTSISHASCNGSNDAEIIVLASGGTTPYSYEVIDGPNNPDVNGNIITGMIAGFYTIQATDANECSATLDVEITEPEMLEILSANITHPICHGTATGSINIEVAGGILPYTFVWSNGASVQNPSNLSSGSYQVTITDANGCEVLGGPYTLFDPAVVTITASDIENTVCNGTTGSVVLTSSDGSSVTLNGETLPSGSTFTGLAAGYYIAYSNGSCQATVGFNILNENSDLFAMVTDQNDVSCYGGNDGHTTITASGGTAPYSFSLNGGTPQSDGVFTNLEAGEYGVLVTDADGCTYVVSFDIDQPTMLFAEIIATGNAGCAGGVDGFATVNATGGVPPYTYSWNTSPEQNTATASGLGAGNYEVTVTDSNGCQTVVSVEIEDGLPLMMEPVADITSVCANNMVQSIFLSASPINPEIVYTWTVVGDNIGLSDGSATGLNPHIPAFIASTAGTAVVSIKATLNDCVDLIEFSITVVDETLVDAGQNIEICVGSNVELSASASNYTNLQWTTSGTGTFNNPNGLNTNYIPSFGDELATQVVLSLTASGECGEVTDHVVVTIYPMATANAGPDVHICAGDSYQVTMASASSYSEIMWTHNGLGNLENANSINPIYHPAAGETGSIRLTIRVRGYFACNSEIITDEMELIINPGIDASAGIDVVTAANTSVQLDGSASGGSGIYAYSWEPASLLIQQNDQRPTTVALAESTLFRLTVIDLMTSCTATDSVWVHIEGMNMPPVAQPDWDTTAFQTPVVINILDNDHDPENSKLRVSICDFPQHGLVVINSDNTITYTPYAGYEGNDSLCYQICDEGMPILCDQAMVYLHVLPEFTLDDLIIYNGVSPNGDGINDTWIIEGIENYPDNEVMIFNRWGDKIRDFLRYDNVDVYWDATNNNGELVPDGTYYYVLKIKNLETFTGWIYVRSGQ